MTVLQKKLKEMESISDSPSLEKDTWKNIWLIKKLFWDKVTKIQQNPEKLIDWYKLIDLIHQDRTKKTSEKIDFYKKAKAIKDIFLGLWIEDKSIIIRSDFGDIEIRINWVRCRLDLDFNRETMRFNAFWKKTYTSETKKINKENLLEILSKYSPELFSNYESKNIEIWTYTEKEIIDEFIKVEPLVLKWLNKKDFYNELRIICNRYWKDRYPKSRSTYEEKRIKLFNERYWEIAISFEEIDWRYKTIELHIWNKAIKNKSPNYLNYYIDDDRETRIHISIFDNKLSLKDTDKNIFDDIYQIILEWKVIQNEEEEY